MLNPKPFVLAYIFVYIPEVLYVTPSQVYESHDITEIDVFSDWLIVN